MAASQLPLHLTGKIVIDASVQAADSPDHERHSGDTHEMPKYVVQQCEGHGLASPQCNINSHVNNALADKIHDDALKTIAGLPNSSPQVCVLLHSFSARQVPEVILESLTLVL